MRSGKLLLGVNIDHIATIRQARGAHYPSVLEAAQVAENAGADADQSSCRCLPGSRKA
jgi:pyridoxine 5-phosphate synthase